jgi:hypothetical protein
MHTPIRNIWVEKTLELPYRGMRYDEQQSKSTVSQLYNARDRRYAIISLSSDDSPAVGSNFYTAVEPSTSPAGPGPALFSGGKGMFSWTSQF